VWEPIITEELHRKVLATLQSRKVSGRRTPRTHLLSGLVRCGKCKGTLFSARRGDVRRYECKTGPDHGGCGGTTVVAGPLEELIADYALFRLDSPEVADAIAGRDSADEQTSALGQQLAEAREALEYLAEQFGAGEIERREWEAARRPIRARVERLERQLAAITRTDALTGLGTGDTLRAQWAELNMDRQAAILRTLITSVTIGPGARGAQRFDPDRAQVSWRL
jgi:hypothetical protein